MKFSQVQDVEYMLRFFEFSDKLIIKFDNKIVSGNSLKIRTNEFDEDCYDKIDIDNARYTADMRYNAILIKYREKFSRWADQAFKRDKLITLKSMIDLCSENKVLVSDNVFYDVDFVESKFHSDFLLVEPNTDFEIIGLAD